jgi:hypothetical protein
MRDSKLTRISLHRLGRLFGVWVFSGFWGSVFGVLFIGCAGPKGESKPNIDQLHLLVTSVALNVDDKPGPDGVGVRVYASRRERAEALPIASGTLDILMFDGNLHLDQLQSAQPHHTWSYPAEKLKPYVQKTTIGISYRFAALWGEDKPTADRVTFVARHTSPNAKQIYSAPSSVQLSLK